MKAPNKDLQQRRRPRQRSDNNSGGDSSSGSSGDDDDDHHRRPSSSSSSYRLRRRSSDIAQHREFSTSSTQSSDTTTNQQRRQRQQRHQQQQQQSHLHYNFDHRSSSTDHHYSPPYSGKDESTIPQRNDIRTGIHNHSAFKPTTQQSTPRRDRTHTVTTAASSSKSDDDDDNNNDDDDADSGISSGLSGSLDSDEELEVYSKQIRLELRHAEMLELAAAAERAAEMGKKSFAGRASTFGDDTEKDLQVVDNLSKPAPLKRKSRSTPINPRKVLAFGTPLVRKAQREQTKIGVLALRDVTEVFPSFKNFHMHLRTHFARKKVDETSLVFQEVDEKLTTSTSSVSNGSDRLVAALSPGRSSDLCVPHHDPNMIELMNSFHLPWGTSNPSGGSEEDQMDQYNVGDDNSVQSAEGSDVGDLLADHTPIMGSRKLKVFEVPPGLHLPETANNYTLTPVAQPDREIAKSQRKVPPKVPSSAKSTPSKTPHHESEVGALKTFSTPLSAGGGYTQEHSKPMNTKNNLPIQVGSPTSPIIMDNLPIQDGSPTSPIIIDDYNATFSDRTSQPLPGLPLTPRGNFQDLFEQQFKPMDVDMLTPKTDVLEKETGSDFVTPVKLRDIRNDFHFANEKKSEENYTTTSADLDPLIIQNHVGPRVVFGKLSMQKSASSSKALLDNTMDATSDMSDLADGGGSNAASPDRRHVPGLDGSVARISGANFNQDIPQSMSLSTTRQDAHDTQQDILHSASLPIMDSRDLQNAQHTHHLVPRGNNRNISIDEVNADLAGMVIHSYSNNGDPNQPNTRFGDSEEPEIIHLEDVESVHNDPHHDLQQDVFALEDEQFNPNEISILAPEVDPPSPVDEKPPASISGDVKKTGSSEAPVDACRCECLISPASSLDSQEDELTATARGSALAGFRDFSSSWKLMETSARPTSPTSSHGNSFNAAVAMFSNLSPTSPSRKEREVALAPPKANDDFISNYLYCSKRNEAVPQAEPLCEVPCQETKLPCADIAVDPSCGNFLDTAMKFFPKKSSSSKLLSLSRNNSEDVHSEPGTWYDKANERFDGFLERFFPEQIRSAQNTVAFQAPALKEKNKGRVSATSSYDADLGGVVYVSQSNSAENMTTLRPPGPSAVDVYSHPALRKPSGNRSPNRDNGPLHQSLLLNDLDVDEFLISRHSM